MKVLKNAGSFEVLSKTEDVISQIAGAARTCYKSEDKASPENDIKLVKNLLTRGHEAMIEMADMTVKFTNVSRGFTHEMVRHRLVSYAQESTRYVDESNNEIVVPPHKDENENLDLGRFVKLSLVSNNHCDTISLTDWFEANEAAYRALRKAGWKPEDARQVLPTAIKADIVVKCNMREWRHIFSMRGSKFAHWEIRQVMLKLLKYCKENIPLIFDDFDFFTTESGQEYARKVMSIGNLKDEIFHYCVSNKIDFNKNLHIFYKEHE